MNNLNDAIDPSGDVLMKSIAKAEILTEDHDDILEEMEEQSEEIGSWIMTILKTIKEVIL